MIKRIISDNLCGCRAFEVYDIIPVRPPATAVLNVATGRDTHIGCLAKVTTNQDGKMFVCNIMRRNGRCYAMAELEDAIPDQIHEMCRNVGK